MRFLILQDAARACPHAPWQGPKRVSRNIRSLEAAILTRHNNIAATFYIRQTKSQVRQIQKRENRFYLPWKALQVRL